MKNKIFFLLMIFYSLTGYSQEKTTTENHPTYRELFFSNNKNVSSKWDNYLDIYQKYFHGLIGKNPNILEIGVQNGGSLQIDSQYFVNGNIYGLDITPEVCNMDLGVNIKTFCFDVKDQEKIQKSFNNIEFDVILDDGSHINTDVIAAFKLLFPKVKPNGIYVIEDLHTSYWSNYGGGHLKHDTAIEFLKKFVDLLNLYHIKDENFIKNLSDDDRYVFEWLESITFYDSVAVIQKLKEPRKVPYESVFSGYKQPIAKIRK